MNITPESIILSITFLINLSLSVFVFLKYPKRKANIVFCLLTLSIALWNFTNLMSSILTDYDRVFFWTQLALATVLFTPSLLLYFAIIFPHKLKIKKWLEIIIFIPGFLLLPFIPTQYNILGFSGEPYGENFIPGPLYIYFVIYFFIFVGLAFGILIWKYKKEQGIAKTQLLYIIIGSLITAVAGITTNGILPLIWSAKLNIYGTSTSIFFGIFTGYAILKYRLMDIRVVLKKSIVYGFIFLIILFTSILIALFLKDVLFEQLGIDPTISIVVLMMIMIFVFPSIKNYTRKELDKIFKKDYIDFSEKIDKLEKTVSSHTQVNDLAKEISESMKEMIKVDKVEFFVIDRRQNEFISQFPQNENKLIKNGLFTALNDGKEVIIKEELNYLKPEGKSGQSGQKPDPAMAGKPDAAMAAEEKKKTKSIIKSMDKLNSSAALPIFTGTELIGIILMGSKEGNRNFTAEDLDLMKQVSGKIGDILGNVLLYKEAVERIQINQTQ